MEGWKHQTGDAPVVSGPIIVSQAGLEALAGNVSTLFAELPSQSWLRGPLVARLLHGDMPRDDAEAVSGLSRNYISKAPEEQRKKRARLNAMRYLLQKLPYTNKDPKNLGALDSLIVGRAHVVYERGERPGGAIL